MRTASIQALYNRKYNILSLASPWSLVFGDVESSGAWIIYGAEKHGKTLLALKLADQLSHLRRVLYVSGEEGLGKTFVDAIKRAGIGTKNKRLRVIDYTPLEELRESLSKRNAPRVVFIDNITVYVKDLQYGALFKLMRDFPKVLFIFLAHEENGQPYGSIAKSCRRFSNIIIRVEGLAAQVSGRCPGGMLLVDDKKGRIYWGDPAEKTPTAS